MASSPLASLTPLWHQTKLVVSNPDASVAFYNKHFQMTLVCQRMVNHETTEFFLVSLRDGEETPSDVTSPAAFRRMLTKPTNTLVLSWTRSETPPKLSNGNEEPYRGFGHIAFNVNDVYAVSKELESNGVGFKKRPDEGRMKGLAFALDPDGYWIEIVRRRKPMPEKFNFSQTMIRAKDPQKTLHFYCDLFGMTLVQEMRMSDFTNYFLFSLPQGTPIQKKESTEMDEFITSVWNPCLEITHNHGTETDPNFHYHTARTEPLGFGGLAFLVDDVDRAVQLLKETQPSLEWIKSDQGSECAKTAACGDPDGYRVQLIERPSGSC